MILDAIFTQSMLAVEAIEEVLIMLIKCTAEYLTFCQVVENSGEGG
jgi:hypothetical protein